MATLPSKMPAGNLLATSTLKLNQYTVSFLVDGVAVSTYTGRYTFPIEYPSAPVKDGYTFIGWAPNPDTMPLGGGDIVAQFVAAGTKTYTISYYSKIQYNNGGSTAYGAATLLGTQTYAAGASISPRALPVKDGYTCDGWDGLPDTMPANDVSVYAYLDLNEYTVTFKADGAVIGEYSGLYTFPITYPSDPEKDGYTFTGWSPSPTTMPLGGGTINATFQAADETDDPDDPGGGGSGGDSGGEEGGGSGETVEGFYFIKASTVDAVTAAIREKTGRTDPFTAKDWAELILSIQAGPGIKSITITEV